MIHTVLQKMQCEDLTLFSLYPEYHIECQSAVASADVVRYFLSYGLIGFARSGKDCLKYFGKNVISCGDFDLAAFSRLMIGKTSKEYLFRFCDDGCPICIDGHPDPVEATKHQSGMLKLTNIHYEMGGEFYEYKKLPNSILVDSSDMVWLMQNVYTNLKNLVESFPLLDLEKDVVFRDFIAEYDG